MVSQRFSLVTNHWSGGGINEPDLTILAPPQGPSLLLFSLPLPLLHHAPRLLPFLLRPPHLLPPCLLPLLLHLHLLHFLLLLLSLLLLLPLTLQDSENRQEIRASPELPPSLHG